MTSSDAAKGAVVRLVSFYTSSVHNSLVFILFGVLVLKSVVSFEMPLSVKAPASFEKVKPRSIKQVGC
jgi:hypothetical protein